MEFLKLQLGQMGMWKKNYAIDSVMLSVHKVEQVWVKKKLAAALFIDVKGAFDHMAKNQLISEIFKLEIDGYLTHWTRLLFMQRKLQLIIDGHTNQEKK